MKDSRASQVTVEIARGDAPTLKLALPALEVRVEEGPDAGAAITRAGPVLRIGTGDQNDLVLSDPAVSRRHAELAEGRDGWVLRDLGSTNGTTLDGVAVHAAPLAPGTRFVVGGTTLRVEAATEFRAAAVPEADRFGELVGESPAMRELYAMIEAVAPTEIGVLLLGESGTGKELLAREVHARSGRRGAFVVFDAGVAQPELMRSDLFGHVAGAFTGAASDRKGAFREAHGGTLFLDEIGELPLELQPHLLRALESRQVAPLGTDRHEEVDVRIVAATHRDLAGDVQAGRFREDLFYRLAIMPVRVPALRDRAEDIPLLADALAARAGRPLTWTPEARDALAAHDWPGNVRALRNLVDRLAILVRDRPVEVKDLDFGPLPGTRPATQRDAGEEEVHLETLERQAIERALSRTSGDRAAAAELLGISMATLKRRLRHYREQGDA